MDPARQIDPLTGLRFLAALAVGLAHLPFLATRPELPKAVRTLMAEGHAGVPFFFVLSGFLLAYSYRGRLGSGAQVRRYALARAARIYPLHAVALATAVLFPCLPYIPTWWQNLLQLTLLHVWVPEVGTYQGANSVTWTLGVEVLLYLSLPAWLWVNRRYSERSPTFWLAMAGLLCGGQAALVLGLAKPLPVAAPWVLVMMPPIHLFEFGVGVALASAWDGLHRRGFAVAPATRRGRAWATAGEVGAFVLLVVLALFNVKASPLFRLSGYYTPAVGLLVLTFALRRGHLSRLMSSRAAVFLGEASFAFYLIHGQVFTHLYRNAPEGTNPYLLAGVCLLTATAVASLLHVAIEKPARAWLLKSRRRQPVPVEVPLRRAA